MYLNETKRGGAVAVHQSSSERRIYKRVPFEAEVLLEDDAELWCCNLMDISLKGILVECPADMPHEPEHTFRLELRLGESAEINMHVKAVHYDNGVVGLEWKDIDLDSLTHLRRLLELNFSDPAEIHRELSELG